MPPPKRNLSVKYRNILKGRLFEFLIKHLFEKAGFTQDLPSDQLTLGLKKRFHGRGATYDPDYFGGLQIGIPFSNPIMVVVEAKFLKNKVDIKIAREFLGASIDFMQYTRINTKQSGTSRYNDMILPRFSLHPILISRKGFDANAKGLLYAHGIKFIGYDDSGIFRTLGEKIDEFLSEINYSKFTNETLGSIKELDDIIGIRASCRRQNFLEKAEGVKSYINSIDSAIAILGFQHTVNIVIYPNGRKVWNSEKFKIRYAGDGLFYLVKNSTKTMRSKIGEFYFPINKQDFERLNKKPGVLEYTFSNLSIVTQSGIKNLKIKPEHYNELIGDLKDSFGIKTANENEENET